MQAVQPQGGFLTSADDVVQPYNLPRNLHEVLPTTLSLKSTSAHTDADADQAKDGHDSARATPPATPDDPMGDGDDLMEETMIPTQQPGEGEQRHLRPKTMLELVEAAERKQDLRDGQPSAPSSLSPDRTVVKTHAEGAHVTAQDGDAVARPTRVAQAPRRPDTARSRKRRRASGDSLEVEVEEAGAASTQATPAKRTRKTAPPVPASARVLRARPQKSEAKIQEERGMEEAFRKAVAE